MHDRNRRFVNRRDFVTRAVAAAAAATVGAHASADELVELQEDDPTAVALKYVHDAKTVDSSIRSGDRFCHNCALYAGSAEEPWAACSIFPGKKVAAQGWCSVWAPRG